MTEPVVPKQERSEIVQRLRNVRLALGGATIARHENGAHYRELPNDEWDALCDMLKAIEAALARPALPAPEAPASWWLIERSQPEGQFPTMWWTHGLEWTEDPNKATRFDTRPAAEAVLEEHSGIKGVHRAFGHLTEHVWLVRGAALPSEPAPPEDEGEVPSKGGGPSSAMGLGGAKPPAAAPDAADTGGALDETQNSATADSAPSSLGRGVRDPSPPAPDWMRALESLPEDTSPAPWTWINADTPGALEWAAAALKQPHCNAVILSKRSADGGFVNLALAAVRGSGVVPSAPSPVSEQAHADVGWERILADVNICAKCWAPLAIVSVRPESPAQYDWDGRKTHICGVDQGGVGPHPEKP